MYEAAGPIHNPPPVDKKIYPTLQSHVQTRRDPPAARGLLGLYVAAFGGGSEARLYLRPRLPPAPLDYSKPFPRLGGL